MSAVISVENLSKAYRLGAIGGATLREDVSRWMARLRGQPDPFLKIGEEHKQRLMQAPDASRRRVAPASEVFWALRNISFQVQPGEVLGVVGRNGAGKSTLLKILSRVTGPTEGAVKIQGRIASLLEVGTGFHPELTGRENIFLNGAILGMTKSEIRSKFDEIVAFSEIERFIDTPVKRYSSGMYVRLAFAVAAHLEPEILVVDEVLAVGDAQFQRKCLGKMREVSSEHGRTVLFVSHNLSAVRGLCQRALLLEEGAMAALDRVNPVLDRYLAGVRAASRLDVDLGGRRPPGAAAPRLQLRRVVVNRGAGIWHGRPLDIEIEFACAAPVEGVSFGIGFCNREGVRVLSLDSDIPGRRLDFPAGHAGVARVSVPCLHLEPDDYVLDVGARSGSDFSLDAHLQCAELTVVPSEATPEVIALRQSGRGGWRLPADWVIGPAAPASPPAAGAFPA